MKAKDILNHYTRRPDDPKAKQDLMALFYQTGLVDLAYQMFLIRGRGMAVGPIYVPESNSFGVEYATETEINLKEPDPRVRSKALEFIRKYDPEEAWVIMLVEPMSRVCVTLNICRRFPAKGEGDNV